MAGLCLLAGAAAEIVQGFRRRTSAAQRSVWTSAGYTLLLAVLLLNAPWLAATALAIFVAVPFALDALRYAGVAVRQIAGGQSFLQAAGAAVWNLAVVVAILLVGRLAANWVVALAAGLRLAATTVNLAAGPRLLRARRGRERDRRHRDRAARAARRNRRAAPASGTGPGRGRSQLDRGAAGGAVCDSRQPHGLRPIGAGDSLAARRRGRRRRLCAGPDVRRDRPAPPVRAPPHARSGAAGVGVGTRRARSNGSRALGRARGPLVARIAHAVCHSRTRGPLFADVRPGARAPDRAADGRDHRGVRSDLGHELVLRHGKLGRRHLELVGRAAHRHVARGDGSRGRRQRSDDARRTRLRGGAGGPGRLGAVLVHRHRRHRRGRREPARAARLADSRRVGRRRAIRRAVVRRHLSHRGDARLRAQVLAAVQGRHEAGVCDPGQSRLVRRARRLRGDVLPA